MKKMLIALMLTIGFAGAANAACCTVVCNPCDPCSCTTCCNPCDCTCDCSCDCTCECTTCCCD